MSLRPPYIYGLDIFSRKAKLLSTIMKPQSGAIHILLPLVLFIALGVIIFFVSSVGKLHRLEEENQALQVEIDKLNADVALLKFKAGL